MVLIFFFVILLGVLKPLIIVALKNLKTKVTLLYKYEVLLLTRNCLRVGQMNKKIIVKSNSLVEASYSLTTVEFRILQIVFSEISEYEDSKEFWESREFIITAKQYANIFEDDPVTAYETLKKASERLFNRYFTYERVWQKPDYIETVKSRWVQKIGCSFQNGQISLQLTDDVKDLVGKLKANFTQYKIKQIANLNSIYALRLYEILMQWINLKKTPVFNLSVLRERLGVLDNEYTRIFDFKKNVLDVGLTQINKNTDLKIKYFQHKTRRSISGFHFEISYKKGKEPKKPLKKIRAALTKEEAESMAKIGESWEELYKRLSSNYVIK